MMTTYTYKGAAKQTVDKGLKVFINKNAEEGNNYNIEVGAVQM